MLQHLKFYMRSDLQLLKRQNHTGHLVGVFLANGQDRDAGCWQGKTVASEDGLETRETAIASALAVATGRFLASWLSPAKTLSFLNTAGAQELKETRRGGEGSLCGAKEQLGRRKT